MTNDEKSVKEHLSSFGGQVRLRRKGGTQFYIEGLLTEKITKKGQKR